MHFITGNFGSGKTSHILNQISSLIKEGQQFLIVVPSRKHKDQLFLQLLQNHATFIGNPIITLSELQQQLMEQLFPNPTDRPQTITNFEKFLIISSIITQNQSNFKAFHNISKRPEIIKMIYRLINSLRDKDIEDLNHSPQSQHKIHDLKLILDEFQKIIATKNVCDSKFAIDLICNNLFSLNPSFFPQHVFIDGFVDYTATQFKLIEHVSLFIENNNKQIAISLTTLPHPIPEQTTKIFYDKFPHATKEMLSDNDNAILVNNFLTNSNNNNNIELHEIQSISKQKEIHHVINQIKKLCLTENYSLNDILIITNNPDSYTSIISSSLRKAQIPFSFSKDEKLSINPLILFVKRCLKIMSQDLTHEHLEFFAQSNYICPQIKTILSKAPIIIPKAVFGKKEDWASAFQHQKQLLTSNEDFTREQLHELELLETTIYHLCDVLFYTDSFQKLSVTKHIEGLIELLNHLKVFDSLSNTQNLIKHKKIIENSIAKDYSALLKLKDILADLKKSLANMQNFDINFASFLFFFTIITDETRYRSEIPQQNTLKILTPKDTRGIFAKAVFVLGLNEGEFPSAPKLELFDGFERTQLNMISKKILGQALWNTHIDFLNEQKLDFVTALSRATHKLFLSRNPINEKGVLFNSSVFLKRLFDIYPIINRIPHADNVIHSSINPNIYTPLQDFEEYFDFIQLSVFQPLINNSTIAQMQNYLQIIDDANKRYFNKNIQAPLEMSVYFGHIPTVNFIVDKYNNNNIPISPTRLESIGRCRYRGLWQNVWKLKPYKLPQFKPEASDYGTLYHHVLEHYINNTKEIPTEQLFNEELLREILTNYINNHHLKNLFELDYYYIYNILKSFIQNIEPKLRENEQALYFELTSGKEHLENQVLPINDSQQLTVYSQIDRVNYNALNNNYSIIDYKKSNIDSYKKYQKTPFNLFQGFLYSELLKQNNMQNITNISYVFLEKQDIFNEFPGGTSKKKYYSSIHEMQEIKNKEITHLISLLGQGNFSPFTLESDIGEELLEIFTDKYGEKFPREYETKCAYCDVQKLCLRKQKKVKSY